MKFFFKLLLVLEFVTMMMVGLLHIMAYHLNEPFELITYPALFVLIFMISLITSFREKLLTWIEN
jgi:putative flippase GtrA